jgi:hypothetical protein
VRSQFSATLAECAGHIAGGDEAAAELALAVVNMIMKGGATKSKPKPKAKNT